MLRDPWIMVPKQEAFREGFEELDRMFSRFKDQLRDRAQMIYTHV
jgi:hypothetical protein